MTDIPAGYCQCGCGQKTAIPKHTDTVKGWVKGVPLRFIKGHNLPEVVRLKRETSMGNKGLSSHGYVRVQTANGREYEHILVAEQMLGRPLKFYGKGHPENEVVHHIDFNKTNNAPENLQVLTHREHVALHDTVCPKRKKHV